MSRISGSREDSVLKKILGIVQPRDPAVARAEALRKVIKQSAQMGGALFGPVAPGSRREFFCLDEHTWVWHEEWTVNNVHYARTTRYDIRPHGIFKAQDGEPYQKLAQEESTRLKAAMHAYGARLREMYAPLLQAA